MTGIKNGVLTRDELTEQFAGDPMDFDRNRDGRLTLGELAVRYAVRREGNEAAKQQHKTQGREESRPRRDRPTAVAIAAEERLRGQCP